MAECRRLGNLVITLGQTKAGSFLGVGNIENLPLMFSRWRTVLEAVDCGAQRREPDGGRRRLELQP